MAVPQSSHEELLGNKDVVQRNGGKNRFKELKLLRKSIIHTLVTSGDDWLVKKGLQCSACETPIWSNVLTSKVGGKVKMEGLGKCGNRHQCPRCAGIFNSVKRKQVKKALVEWEEVRGGKVGCLTATIRKVPSSDPEAWKDQFQLQHDSWSVFSSGGKGSYIEKFKESIGLRNYYKAVEDTSNRFGFHWHIHAGLFMDSKMAEKLKNLTVSQRLFLQYEISKNFHQVWNKIVENQLKKGKKQGKYQHIDLRKFKHKEFVQAPYPVLQFSYKDEEGKIKKRIVNFEKDKNGNYDFHQWKWDDWIKKAEFHCVPTENMSWNNIRVIIKGGVSFEFPLSVEHWADYLCKELAGGLNKLAKVGKNDEPSYSWLELIKMSDMYDESNEIKKEQNLPIEYNWPKENLIFRSKFLHKKRLSEFSRVVEDKKRISFYNWLFDGEEENDESEEEYGVIPDLVSKRLDFDMALEDQIEEDENGDEYELHEKLNDFENGEDIEDGKVFHGKKSDYYRKTLGKCGFVTPGTCDQYRDSELEKIRMALALSLYKRGHLESKLVKDRLGRIEEIEMKRESIHDFLKITRNKISRAGVEKYDLISKGFESKTWKYFTDEEINDLKVSGKINGAVQAVRLNKFKGTVEYFHENDDEWVKEKYRKVVKYDIEVKC